MFCSEVEKALKKACGATGTLSTPPNPALGDLASNAAFTLGGNPMQGAEKIAGKIKPSGMIEKITATKGYVNFYADHEKVSEAVIKNAGKEKFAKKKEKVMVEYSQPNTHKAFHIGHIRSTAVGGAIANIYEKSGYKVVRANYQGDTGAHIAKCLWCMQKFHSKEKPPANKARWLADIYRESIQKLKDNEEYEEEVEKVYHEIETDKKMNALWKETRQWSIDAFDKIYAEFGEKFDRFYWESKIENRAVDISKELVKKKIAKIDDGATIIDLGDLGVYVLLRQDGTPLYSAKDLALAEAKFKEYNIDISVYVVGAEQTQHLRQAFKVLEMMGFKQAKKCVHVPFQLVMLESGKMASREGKVIWYEDLRKEALEKAKKAIEEKNPDLKNKEKVALMVALGAMKYEMLKVSSTKTITFSWERALDFEGESAPYCQYAYARAKSILRKSKKKPKVGSVDAWNVVSLLGQFSLVVEESKNQPHKMANFAYDLAREFNSFYHKTKVIGAEDEPALLALVEAFCVVEKEALRLLGIDAPEEM